MPPQVSAAALRRCDPAGRITTLAGTALGTTWRVSFVVAPGDAGSANRSSRRAAGLRAAIGARLAAIVAAMSQWEPTSLLSRFNRAAAGTWFTLPPDFAIVLAAALDLARRTGGAFDPSHGRAAAMLGFGAEPRATSPTPARFDEALSMAGWQRLAYDQAGRRLRQPGGLWLDFSGIAKGYAVDALADVLADHGFADVLVEIGGELAGRGLKPGEQPWWVDLEAPPGAEVEPLRLALHDLAVATSGDYVRGAHTLDPRTGRPLAGHVAAVSVVHARAMLADAWATALTVLGPNAGLALAAQEGLAARFIVRDRDAMFETLSPALRAMMAD